MNVTQVYAVWNQDKQQYLARYGLHTTVGEYTYLVLFAELFLTEREARVDTAEGDTVIQFNVVVDPANNTYEITQVAK